MALWGRIALGKTIRKAMEEVGNFGAHEFNLIHRVLSLASIKNSGCDGSHEPPKSGGKQRFTSWDG